jgi:hypothetical protein
VAAQRIARQNRSHMLGLARRIDNIQELRREVAAWETAHDATATKVDWQFTTADARIKLRKLYPSIQE